MPVEQTPRRHGTAGIIAKRTFDIVASLLGLLLLSPLLLIVIALIYLDDGVPVFFRQQRVGQHGKLFEIWKFRTMSTTQATNAPKITAAGDDRITRVGHYLRRFKLDELPQLLNVLAGTMSLVGPRPEISDYVEKYPSGMRKIVLSVRPGITDLASIEFKNEMERLAQAEDPETLYVESIMPRKLDLYVEYVQTRSFTLDLRIILRTLAAVVSPGKT